MSEMHTLALYTASQVRTDIAALESELEVVHIQLARLPTRGYLCRMLLLAMAGTWALLIALALLLR